jgi:putative transposase
MRNEGLATVRAYRRHPGPKGEKQHPAAANVLNQKFVVTKPSQILVTDFAYIRTYEGWLYVTVVIDLYSRRVIGWTLLKTIFIIFNSDT